MWTGRVRIRTGGAFPLPSSGLLSPPPLLSMSGSRPPSSAVRTWHPHVTWESLQVGRPCLQDQCPVILPWCCFTWVLKYISGSFFNLIPWSLTLVLTQTFLLFWSWAFALLCRLSYVTTGEKPWKESAKTGVSVIPLWAPTFGCHLQASKCRNFW